MSKLKVGIVGAAGRPTAFLKAFAISQQAELAAACDLDETALAAAFKGLEGISLYTDYSRMLLKEKLDVVIIGTPMHLHASQALAALEEDVHVISEVTAGVSIDECRQLLKACKKSKAQYILAENCNYMKPYMQIKQMIKAGLFGQIHYAEGEYIHDCRDLIYQTPWRLDFLYKRPGVTYGTHSLGPILSWLEGDRIQRVLCLDTGQADNYDKKGQKIHGAASSLMLCQTALGRLIKVRLDLSSPHPYSLNFVLQGSQASYRGSLMSQNSFDLICLAQQESQEEWSDLAFYDEEYLPLIWQQLSEPASSSGHGGADIIMICDFIAALHAGRQAPLDIYAALDMTLPGLISQQSAQSGGVWLDVPDPREW